ncbi:MAG: hypothetical protein R2830_04210 [Saprospiraceae bacterium]
MKPITESHIEQSAIETLQAQGWAYVTVVRFSKLLFCVKLGE